MNKYGGVKIGELECFGLGENVGRSNVEQEINNLLKFESAPKEKRLVKRLGDTNIEFEIFDLLDEYDSSLKDSTIDWDFEKPYGDLRYICISMVETMFKHGGVGLAANQIGLPYSIFVMGGGGYANAIVNPRILQADGEEVSKEGCLSYPGLFLNIKRANHIDVEFYDMNGKLQQRTFEGLTARIFLHEYDHLQGVVFTSLVSKITLQRERDKRKTNLKKIKRAKELNERQQKIAQLSKKVKEAQDQLPQNNGITIVKSNDTKSNLPSGVIDLSTLK